MSTEALNKFDTGSIFVPFKHIRSCLKEVCNAYFTAKYPKKRHTFVKKHTDGFINGVCAISYLQYLQRDYLKSSGEVAIPSVVLRDTIWESFPEDFIAIADILRKKKVKDPVITFRRAPRQLCHGYGVHYNNMCKIVRLDGDVEDICRGVTSTFFMYVKEHSKCTVDEDIKEFAENYYKYEIDMEIANKVCIERNGVSFDDATAYLRNSRVMKMSDEKFIRCRDAERDFYLCKSFNSNSFVVRQVYGRMYTPFHNIAKAYRVAVKTRSTHEHIEEAIDMKGAFVRGALCATAYHALEFGKKDVADKIIKELSEMNDPYAFAEKSGVTRSVAKNFTLAFVFSSISDIDRRNTLYYTLVKRGIVDSVEKHAEEFLAVVDKHRNIMYMSNRDLDKVLGKFSQEDCVLRGIYGSHGVEKVQWTNRTTGKGRYSLKNYITLLRRIRLAIGQHLIVECFKEAFGEDVFECFTDTVRMFDRYTDNQVEHHMQNVNASCKKYGGIASFRRDVRRACAFNLSILCQIAEGDMMFRNILPMIKEKTGCNKLITLHDAIYCPKSYADKVRKCIGKELEKKYIECILKVCKNNETVKEATKMWHYEREVFNV